MKTQNVELEYLAQYNAFGIADEAVENFVKQGVTPLIGFGKDNYKRLECAKPEEDAPLVAFLLGREEGFYTIDFNYAKAIAQSGVRLRFLTYHDNVAQMAEADGLILPGGRFASPNEFYTDPLKNSKEEPSLRSCAYITSITEAEKRNLPMLGICAGAQMIGGVHGMRMYRNVKEYTHTDLEHRTKILSAHKVVVDTSSSLYELLGQKEFIINSRHTEAMMPNDKISDLKIYALAPDGTPEAWGNREKNILCIQWHPEDFAAGGDESMQKIYNWLAMKAGEYKMNRMVQDKGENH